MADIYSRTGDQGETSLIGGRRVAKSNARVDLYGQADELSSCLGLAAAMLDGAEFEGLRREIVALQGRMLDMGSVLADPQRCEGFEDDGLFAAEALEAAIDAHETHLDPLKEFILPGGTQAAAALHLARTVCRRVERAAVALQDTGEVVPQAALIWINRLSDYLFVAARRANALADVADIRRSDRNESKDESQ